MNLTEPEVVTRKPPTPLPPAEPAAAPAVKTHRKRWLTIVLIGSAAVLCVLAYQWWRARNTTLVTYATVPAEKGEVLRSITATGTVNPVLNIIVGAYVSGVIQDMYCDFNTRVTKGQLCAKIDPRPYQTIVDQNRANVGTAKAQLLKDQASLAYAELTYTRQQSLFHDGVTSQDALDNAKSMRDELRAQVALDQASITQRQAELENAEVNLAYTDIRSPVNGMVIQRNITIGQTVAASFQTPTLFLIATDLTKMQVDTNVSESDLAFLKEGCAASFTVESFPNRVFHGTVVQARQAPQSIQNVITYDIVVGVQNSDLALKPGMTATVRIITGDRLNVLRVPNQAIRFVPSGVKRTRSQEEEARQQRTVWLLRDGVPHRIALRLGLEGDSYTEVLNEDLHENDAIILSEQSNKRKTPSTALPPRL